MPVHMMPGAKSLALSPGAGCPKKSPLIVRESPESIWYDRQAVNDTAIIRNQEKAGREM